jgi:hypothetical protein
VHRYGCGGPAVAAAVGSWCCSPALTQSKIIKELLRTYGMRIQTHRYRYKPDLGPIQIFWIFITEYRYLTTEFGLA